MRKHVYLTDLTATFSPSGREAQVEEIDEGAFFRLVKEAFIRGRLVPRVGHENTARLLALRLQKEGVEALGESGVGPLPLFSRENVALGSGDELLAAIPQARFSEAREFTDEEVAGAKFRYFLIKVR